MESGPPGYRDFVLARLETLRRTAYLMCGDWHTADDIVSVALFRLLKHWKRVSSMEQPDAYVRQMIMRGVIDETRRPWRREHTSRSAPDVEMFEFDPADRMTVLAALAQLPPRRRAVIVLRYFNGLSVEETAEALGCSQGTVKSQTSRALDSLRAALSGAFA